MGSGAMDVIVQADNRFLSKGHSVVFCGKCKCQYANTV